MLASHLCENSITNGILICSLLIVFFVQFEIFLVLDIMSNLLLQPGTLWYYIVRLWHLFKFSVLAGFISHHPRSGRGALPLCRRWEEQSTCY